LLLDLPLFKPCRLFKTCIFFVACIVGNQFTILDRQNAQYSCLEKYLRNNIRSFVGLVSWITQHLSLPTSKFLCSPCSVQAAFSPVHMSYSLIPTPKILERHKNMRGLNTLWIFIYCTRYIHFLRKYPRNICSQLFELQSNTDLIEKSHSRNWKRNVILHSTNAVWDKAIPLQAWTCPEVSRRLRLPDIKTIGTWRWQGYQPYAPAAFTPRKYS
jgi:hypothetical protein